MSIHTRIPSFCAGANCCAVLWCCCVAAADPCRGDARPGEAAPQQNDGRPPARVGRLALIYQLHRARLVHRRDGRPRTALLCLETKRRRTPPVVRGQHVVDHLPRLRSRRDARVERLRRWFGEGLRFARRESIARLDGPPEPGQLLSPSSIRRIRSYWWG